jgi:cobalamin-dependent methionine synthase I
VSPGYGDFGLEDQPQLLELSGGAALGITVTENFMMVPRKSVTAVAAVRRK